MSLERILEDTILSYKKLKGFSEISDVGKSVLLDMIVKYTKDQCRETAERTKEEILGILKTYDPNRYSTEDVLSRIEKDIKLTNVERLI